MSEDEEQSIRGAASTESDVDAVLDSALLDRMTDAFFAVDGDWRFTYLNDGGKKVIREAAEGSIADDLIGVNIWEAIPDLVDTEFHEQYQEAMRTQDSVEFDEYYEPLDTWYEVRAYPSESGLSVFFRDVTTERKHLIELEEREETLRAITESIADSDRSFEERVARLLEIGSEMLGTEYATLSRIRDDRYVFEVVYAPDDSIAAGDEVDLSTTNCERVVVTEESLALSDVGDDPELAEREGHTEWGISCYLGAPVRVDGTTYGTFCFYDRDPRTEPFAEWQVTIVELMAEWVSSALERQVIEENLRRQNDRLEEFAGIVSHDLRSPLAIAKGQTELVAEECDSDHLEKARRAHDRMEQIVTDVLTMAQTGTVVEDPEPVDLTEAASAAWTSVETADATLDAAEAPTVSGDEDRLIRLLENLFGNAVEHGGSDVHVAVEPISGGFAVADDGPGVPPEDREGVFDHGFSTRDDGTGFGLSIVRTIAEAHGWSASLTASASGGARFEFVETS